MNRLLFFLLAILLIVSCTKSPEERCLVDPEIKIDLNFKSFEDSIPAIQTKKQLIDFFSRHVALRDIFFGRPNYGNDSVFVNNLFLRFTHPAFDTLLLETKKVFGDAHELKEEFQTAFANMKYYYPAFKAPRVETVITGCEADLYVSDTLIIVGLDYFLGRKGKYRPNMHEYMLRRYEKNYIVPSAMLLYGIDSKYNYMNPGDRTVLADMITYGKAFYFAKHMLPCAPDSLLIGYTGREIEGAKVNQDRIWSKLIDDEALFSVSHQMKQRYIAERPKVFEIGNECPGRIGIWVGWQIVNEYGREHSNTSLPDFMHMTDAQKILRGSKYSSQVTK